MMYDFDIKWIMRYLPPFSKLDQLNTLGHVFMSKLELSSHYSHHSEVLSSDCTFINFLSLLLLQIAIFATAVSAFLGWPFAAVLG